MIRSFSCALVRKVIEGDPDAVGKGAASRIPRAISRPVVTEPPTRIAVNCVLPPVIAKTRIEVKGRLGLGVEPCGDLKHHSVEPARQRTAQLSEEADVLVRRLERRNPGKTPSHDLAFHPPSLGIEHFASPSLFL